MIDNFEPFAEEPRVARRRSSRYEWAQRLNKVVTYPFGWYCVAVFNNSSGATYWKKKLAEAYEDFEFNTRSDCSENTSRLYARIRLDK